MIKFVTSNEHKFTELKSILSEFRVEIEWIRMKYEEIQADTTEEISEDSCKKLRKLVDGSFFIEDTGLYVPVLGGFPGPYSSYVNRTIGNMGLLKLVNADRSAYFETVISLSLGGEIYLFKSSLKGTISMEESGVEGFGYDPIFIPEGYSRTLSELGLEEKNRISHRRGAAEKMVKFLRQMQ